MAVHRNLPAERKRLGIRIPRRAASSWSDCPHAGRHDGDGRTLRFRARAADRRERRLRSCLAAAFSRPGGAEISCLQGIENSGNAEIVALVCPREARKWTTPTRTSSAPPHLNIIWSRHLLPRARKLSWLQSIENSRNEKILPSRLRNKVLPAPPSRRRLPRPIVDLLNRGVSVARIVARENLRQN